MEPQIKQCGLVRTPPAQMPLVKNLVPGDVALDVKANLAKLNHILAADLLASELEDATKFVKDKVACRYCHGTLLMPIVSMVMKPIHGVP